MKISPKSKMTLHLLGYYLIILLIPTIFITIIYFIAQNALIDVQKEKNYRILENTVNDFDNQLEGLCNIATYLSRDAKVIQLSKANEEIPSNSYFNTYKIAGEFSTYALTNKLLKEICIWFTNKDYIISVPMVIPKTNRGLSTLETFQGEKWEDIEEEYCTKYHYIEMNYSNSKEKKRVVQSLSSIDNGIYNGAIIITLDNKVIQNYLREIKGNSNSSVFLIDTNGDIINSLTQSSTEEEISNISQLHTSKSIITYNANSRYFSWSFVVLTPKSELTNKIGAIKYIMLFLYVVAIMGGIVICFYYWHKNKKMVNQYYNCLEKISISNEIHRDKKVFWKSLGSFLDQVENLQSILNTQQEILKKESIEKLLLGKYENIQQFELEVGDVAKTFNALKTFYVIVIRYDVTNFNSKEEILVKAQDIFKPKLTSTYWIYNIDYYTYGIILGTTEDNNVFNIKEELYKFNLKNNGSYKNFIGMSQPNDIMHISKAYTEAIEACKSASFFQVYVPIIKEKKYDIQGQVMSLEIEIRLEQALFYGTIKDMDSVLLNLRNLNTDQIQHYYWLEHTTNTLQCILVRYLKNKNNDELIKKVQKSKWPDEVINFFYLIKYRQTKAQEEKFRKEKNKIKNDLKNIMLNNFSNPNFNLAIVAEKMEIPEQRLYKDFKLYFGITFSDYLESLRINEASILLKRGKTVKEVAITVGYNSDYSFRRAFKRNTGIPPSTYSQLK
ncbi:MAG: AraC family transcriptional regulator [Lachnospirales bacterium]